MFTEKDLQQIKNKGITVKLVEAQVNRIKNGMSYSNLVEAANIGNGIEKYSEQEMRDLIDFYETEQNNYNIIKFVPASGAASRMFKFLFQFLNDFDVSNESIDDYVNRSGNKLIKTFSDCLNQFPFYEEVLNEVKSQTPNFKNLSKDEACYKFVHTMLLENGLNYSFLPKGLLPFHQYKTGSVTAFREHLLESTLYASSNGISNLHFTVSEIHHSYFNTELNKVKSGLENSIGTTFNVSFSYQKAETETLALTTDNEIYRNDDGSILFRPAGHGALLENLNDLDNDVVFIKNIDNIVVFDKNKKISDYKKMIAGVLLKAQNQAFAYLEDLDNKTITEEDTIDMALFLSKTLNVPITENFDDLSLEKKIIYLKNKLNRPMRVCAMVKNEGEPGGGPFWVKDINGEISLQIVEFAQIDIDNKQQADIVKNATHFNPTDLVCGIKNYKGKKFDLMNYVDPEAAFITMKTQNGVDIQALELPGLWNGSMAHWNSIFVEVPVETFNPVKTVNDLLKPAHQVL
ncbi:DUF4301 family protein [Litoribaculum gwangyangense]|uniref:DUF4301 domain-containing protein n=1 Tax=Litoribaculum gwangyangense TaxID=1130722 RepID=A0ABP9C542_9FLAO